MFVYNQKYNQVRIFGNRQDAPLGGPVRSAEGVVRSTKITASGIIFGCNYKLVE